MMMASIWFSDTQMRVSGRHGEKLQHLRYFVAVFEEGSFSAGAQRVNATQSGLSMHVRQLEDRFQVQLLNRSSTGVTPTEAGETLLQ